MPADRDAMIQSLRESGAAGLEALLTVPPAVLDAGAYEHGWTVRQLMAHLAALELSYRRLAATISSPGQPAAASTGRPFDMDSYNARQVERRSQHTTAALIDEFVAGRAALIIEAQGYPAELLSMPARSAGGSEGAFAEVLSAVAGRHVLGHVDDLLAAAGADPGEAERAAAALRLAAEEAAQLCERTTAEAWLRRPDAAEWSPANIAGHIAEIMPYWAEKAAAAAGIPGSVVGRDLNAPERVGALVDAEQLSPEEAAARIRASVQQACRTLGTVPASHWGREVNTLRFGTISLRDCLQRLVVDHACEHAQQLAAASRRASGAQA